jgi:hypothetical protein
MLDRDAGVGGLVLIEAGEEGPRLLLGVVGRDLDGLGLLGREPRGREPQDGAGPKEPGQPLFHRTPPAPHGAPGALRGGGPSPGLPTA